MALIKWQHRHTVSGYNVPVTHTHEVEESLVLDKSPEMKQTHIDDYHSDSVKLVLGRR